jgi:hypothetical protein
MKRYPGMRIPDLITTCDQVCPQPGSGSVDDTLTNPWLAMMEATLGPINVTDR